MGFRDSRGDVVFGLELVSWRDDLAVSEMEKKGIEEGETGMRIKCSMNLPRGFDLQKRVLDWVDEWQNLPYISPYENAFHLAPNSDQAEKWTVGLIHELLSLLVSRRRKGEFVLFGRVLGVWADKSYELGSEKGKPIRAVFSGNRKGSASCSNGGKKKDDYNRWRKSDDDEN
ncbi:hypothetical protein DH2020_011276 [Rehmannia glutinosa]|uniref:PORR domain-containing protein n=1 Tax=Rehmannia glutinosa TaxID=99300 RepID=A0ABR0XCV0_REHGL